MSALGQVSVEYLVDILVDVTLRLLGMWIWGSERWGALAEKFVVIVGTVLG